MTNKIVQIQAVYTPREDMVCIYGLSSAGELYGLREKGNASYWRRICGKKLYDENKVLIEQEPSPRHECRAFVNSELIAPKAPA